MAWLMPTLLALLLGTTGLADQFHQALEASQQGRFAEALGLWDGVIELAPADSAAWSNRGNVRLALGDPEGAIADQSEAIRLEPDAIDPHLLQLGFLQRTPRGRVLTDAGRAHLEAA